MLQSCEWERGALCHHRQGCERRRSPAHAAHRERACGRRSSRREHELIDLLGCPRFAARRPALLESVGVIELRRGGRRRDHQQARPTGAADPAGDAAAVPGAASTPCSRRSMRSSRRWQGSRPNGARRRSSPDWCVRRRTRRVGGQRTALPPLDSPVREALADASATSVGDTDASLGWMSSAIAWTSTRTTPPRRHRTRICVRGHRAKDALAATSGPGDARLGGEHARGQREAFEARSCGSISARSGRVPRRAFGRFAALAELRTLVPTRSLLVAPIFESYKIQDGQGRPLHTLGFPQ